MFDLEKQITEWRQELLRAGISESDILELENHLREDFRGFAAGMSEKEAFQAAVRQLGGGEVLRAEFAKVAPAFHPKGWRHNPVALNIFAAWFLFIGLNSLCAMPLLSSFMSNVHNVKMNLFVELLVAVAIIRILIGVGLLLRINVARHVATGWSVMILLALSAGQIFFYFYAPALSFTHSAQVSSYYHLMGFNVPMVFGWIISGLNLVLSAWAIYWLNRKPVRKFFRFKTEYV